MQRKWLVASFLFILMALSVQPASAYEFGVEPDAIDVTVIAELDIKGNQKGVAQTISIDLGAEYHAEVMVSVHIWHWDNKHANWELEPFQVVLDGSSYDLTVLIERTKQRPAGLYYIKVYLSS